MKKKIKYTDEPLGRLQVVRDFLPTGQAYQSIKRQDSRPGTSKGATAETIEVQSLKNQFESKDLAKIQAELSDFRIVILFLLLFEKSFRDKVSISEKDMGFEIGRAVVSAVARECRGWTCENNFVIVQNL